MKIAYYTICLIFKKIGIFILIFLLPGISQNVQGQGIRSGASFLKILPGARQQGLSGSSTALLDEIYAFYANPAATGFFREHQWSVTYTKWITDIYNISFNYGRPIQTPWSKRTGIVLGINYQGIKEFDSSQGATPPASASDMLITASIGNPVPVISKNLSIGTNIKYLKSDLDKFSGSAIIFDIGSLYRSNRFRLSKGEGGLFKYGIFSAGLAVTQLGSSLQFVSTDTPLPRTFRAGAAFYAGTHSGFQIQIAADYRDIKDEISTFGFGAELSWRQRISFRGGYNFNDRMLSKYSFGLSIRFDDIRSAFLKSRNNALNFDFVALENNDFFANAYRASITHIPIGTEKYSFLTNQDEVYSTKEPIPLSWEDTKDPDLYDDANFGYLVTKNRLGLEGFIEKTENWEIDFEEGLENSTAFAINQITLKNDGESQLNLTLQPLEAGDYFWAAWVYDTDRHVRFAADNHQKIRHFRVVSMESPVIAVPAPPALASINTMSNLVLTKSVTADPIRLDIHFPFNIDTLNYYSQEQLNMLGIALNSKEFRNLSVELGGHTDERGSVAYNEALSLGRVTSAKNYLVDEIGIAENRVSAVGYGESKPIYPYANSEEMHASNRRVELKFIETARIGSGSKPPKVVLRGDTYLYKLRIENMDTATAGNIELTDIVPNSIRHFQFPVRPELTGDTLTWTFDSLEQGDSLVVSYEATAPNFVTSNPFKMVNPARVSAANDKNLNNNIDSTTVFVIGTPDSLIYIDSDNTQLGMSEKEALLTWAKYLQNSPTIDVCIECYANNQGSGQKNSTTSQEKAESAKDFIVNWLVENRNIIESDLNIHAKGRGNLNTITSPDKRNRIVIKLRPCN